MMMQLQLARRLDLRVLWAALVVLGPGCAARPVPDALREADAALQSPMSIEAQALVPQAHARAAALAHLAHDSAAAGDIASAQLLAERAVAATSYAHALSRVARAERLRVRDSAELDTERKELALEQAAHASADADLAALQMRLNVLRDAMPPVPSAAADAERNRARAVAAQSLLAQGRLLCSATRLLLTDAEPKTSLRSDLEAAEKRLASAASDLDRKAAFPIDEASRLRAACLTVLTGARRTLTRVSDAPGIGDVLFERLSKEAWQPTRQDHGIVVTVGNPFNGSDLRKQAREALQNLFAIARDNPRFPVLVTVRGRGTGSKVTQSEAREHALALIAKQERVLGFAVSTSADGAQRAGKSAELLEFVFVAPESL